MFAPVRASQKLGNADEVLKVHFLVEAQSALDFSDGIGRTLEGVIHVVAGGEVACVVGEFATTELGDFLDFCSFCLELAGNCSNEFVDTAFDGFGIKNNQTLVFAAHRWVG